MKRTLFFYLTLCFLTGSFILQAAPNPRQPVPSPERMQAAIWKVGEMHDFRLEGLVRTPKGSYPIVLRTLGRIMVFEFLKNPLQIRVEYTPSGSLIYMRNTSQENWRPIEGKERLANVLDSDVTYEDLGADFLRWQDVRPVGADSIKTLPAWTYEAYPPGPSQYTKARFWISSQYLAVLRVDAFNEAGQVIKRVEINGVQRVGKAYTIKEVMISKMIPGREVSSSRTYIDIRKAAPGSGLSS